MRERQKVTEIDHQQTTAGGVRYDARGVRETGRSAVGGNIEKKCAGVALSSAAMEKTTSRKEARRRLMERQQSIAEAREARERANIGDLTEFTVRVAQVDEVDAWLADRIEKLKEEADRKRQAHRTAAGKALQAMRLRGETLSNISTATGYGVSRVREYLRYATEAQAADVADAPSTEAQVVPLPNRTSVDADGTPAGDAVVGAQ